MAEDIAAKPQPRLFIIRLSDPDSPGGENREAGYVVAERIALIAPQGGSPSLEGAALLGSLRELFARGEAVLLDALPLPAEKDPNGGGYQILGSAHGTNVSPPH